MVLIFDSICTNVYTLVLVLVLVLHRGAVTVSSTGAENQFQGDDSSTDMYKMTVGQGVVYAYEAYEVK